MNKSVFGIIGLGVMGRSLAQNVAKNGFSLSVYNRHTPAEKHIVPKFLEDMASFPDVQGSMDLEEFVSSLALPRKILLMVNAGAAVDSVLEQLLPMLSPGDMVIDGGNSHYTDTQRRVNTLSAQQLHFVGAGISGGEQGALKGPSMMVGCTPEVYQQLSPIFEAIAAKDTQGLSCVANVGTDGCGHFVKTIHNGIEYAEMQLLAECYALLAPTHTYPEISNLFKSWNEGALSSYLLGITSEILEKKEDGAYLLDKVLDKAGSKGTGSWSSQSAFQLGVPASMINSAVTARYISALKEKRVQLAKKIDTSTTTTPIDIQGLKETYTFARIINHYQGFEIIKSAAMEQGWSINLSKIARIWTQGCIIKSRFMESLVDIFKTETDLLQHPSLFSSLKNAENHVTGILNFSFKQRTSTTCISNSYQYYIALTTSVSSAKMIQAQRDEFGAHTYRRIDAPEDKSFTSNWTSNG